MKYQIKCQFKSGMFAKDTCYYGNNFGNPDAITNIRKLVISGVC